MPKSLTTYRSSSISLFVIFLLTGACQTDQSKELPGFEIHPDFQLELLASEPLILDPVELKFDASGRAFVLEMPGYPLREEESRLVLLEDTDGDGQYDHRQLFADKLQLASSFMPYREGFLVAAPPDLLYIRDTDEDKVADDYQVIMSGFSTGNLQHNFNGLHYGLDNWIYAANGGNSGHPYFVADTTIRLDMRGDDIRFRLDPPALKRVGESSGGYGLAFDSWGHMYETHNLEHVSHLVFENRYLEDLPAARRDALTLISDHDENGLARIYPIGEQESRVNHPEQSGYFSGSCGITFYGGGNFPEAFNNNLFVADVVLNLIHLDVLSPDGAAFKTSRMREKADFLASIDRAFRPVNLTTGPDGALYVTDIHREVIEHPEWIPDEIEETLDLNAGKDQGRIYRITPKNKKGKPYDVPDLSGQTSRELIQALGHANQWVRMTAQRLLVERQEHSVIPDLEQIVIESGSALARLHALWTLEGLDVLRGDLLRQSLKDEVEGVRESAIKIVETRIGTNSEWIPKLIERVADEAPRVRMQAALALSSIADPQFIKWSEEVRSAFHHLLQEQQATDQWLILAAAAALQRDAFLFSRHLLAGENKLNEQQQKVAEILARVIGKQHDTQTIASLLEDLNRHKHLSSTERASWIDGLATGWAMNVGEQIDEAVAKALEVTEAEAAIPLIHAAGKLRRTMGLPISDKIKASLARAKRDLLNDKLPVEQRLELLQLVKLEDFDQRKTVLYNLLDNRRPLVLQKEALQQLWAGNDPSVGPVLIDLWPSLGPETRKGAGDILLRKSYHHDVLMTALEEGRIKVGELNFDLERRRTLLFWSEPEIQERAKALLSDAGVVTRKAALEKMRPALEMEGDFNKGKELFSIHCGTCHRYADLGVEVGPVLTEISRKSKASLLHDILDPNAAVDTRYLNHRIETKDGNIFTGIVESETDAELSLLTIGGQQQTIRKDNIKSFSSLGLSLMPEGLESVISEQDMADLLAFLQQQVI